MLFLKSVCFVWSSGRLKLIAVLYNFIADFGPVYIFPFFAYLFTDRLKNEKREPFVGINSTHKNKLSKNYVNLDVKKKWNQIWFRGKFVDKNLHSFRFEWRFFFGKNKFHCCCKPWWLIYYEIVWLLALSIHYSITCFCWCCLYIAINCKIKLSRWGWMFRELVGGEMNINLANWAEIQF